MLKTLNDFDFKAKKVFMRVDFNVPMNENGVADDTRIREALKSVAYVIEHGGLLSLAAHFGRPKGEKDPRYSLKPVADYINDKKYFKAVFVEDCIGEAVANARALQQPGEVLILENLRFYKEEEKNDPVFAEKLAYGYDIYVNDAFGVSHRKHASVYGVPAVMKNKAAGFLIEKETYYFDKLINDPDRPFAAILGGAKVSDKIGVIESLIDKADLILIGGAMAYTFLKYQGYNTGISLVEADQFDVVEKILDKAAAKGLDILLPIDHLISREFNGPVDYAGRPDIPDGFMGLDIGGKTAMLYMDAVKNCKTVLWNGPMGVFENKAYSNGTFMMAKAIAGLDAMTVIGGGDSVAAVNQAGLADKMSHLSTGGGASLEYIEYGGLPGIDILKS